MRLDSIEIKVTLGRDQVLPALQAMDLPTDRPAWRIHFIEDVSPGVAPTLPLQKAGLTLRVREREPGEHDVTAKLRPARHSQLPGDWLAATKGDGWEFKVQADWAGSRVLAASVTAPCPDDRLNDVLAGGHPVTDLVTTQQQRYVQECADIRVNLDAVVLLPPVTAVRWRAKKVVTPTGTLSVRAERWTVDDLDFLELSIVEEPDDDDIGSLLLRAGKAQTALAGYVASLGFTVASDQEPKTKQVIEHLAAAAVLA